MIANALNGATGNEIVATPVQFGSSSLGGSFTVVGFALCQPPDPTAPPSATPPLYGCTPNAQVTVVTQASNSVTITVNLSHAYVDLTGQVQVAFITRSLEGFILLEGVEVTLTAPLLDAGGGMKSLGPAEQASITTTNSQVQIHSNIADLEAVIGLVANMFFSKGLSDLSGEIADLMNPVLASAPPFTL